MRAGVRAQSVRAGCAAGFPLPGAAMNAPGIRRGRGFFGKLPARGDFVRAGLPRDFVDPWDAWLQRVLAGSRDAAGRGLAAGLAGGAGLAFRAAAGAVRRRRGARR